MPISATKLWTEETAPKGAVLFAKIGELGGEGIVSKRTDAPYTSGRFSTWLKTKHAAIRRLPGVGLCPGRATDWGAATGRAAVHAPGRPGGVPRPGVLDEDAREALRFLTRPKPWIPIARPGRGVRWVERRLVATVKHFGRTGTGALRAGVLQGLSAE